jgi:hypothetical protein
MTELQFDATGAKLYETGVDHGVLYLRDGEGLYSEAHVWNGLTAVTESPGGAESNKQYADNIEYLNLLSAETFGGTIEAFTYPDAFGVCDGTAEPVPGVKVGQQSRKTFGFAWRTLIGNDIDGTDYGYKLHLAYGALAAPSEKSNATVNDSPEAITFSWEFTTTPVAVPGLKPSAILTIDSTKVDPAALAVLEEFLYGTEGSDARLPLPADVIAIFEEDGLTEATPTKPSNVGNVITIPSVTGVVYKIGGVTKPAGTVTITTNTIVDAVPATGFKFPPDVDTDWGYTFA